MITYLDWQVRNSQRKYPIDEACSAADDSGTPLPESFLVDANIWAPKYLYDPTHPLRFVYLSSAQISASMVSLTILGCTDHLGSAEAQFVPLGAVSLIKPVDPYRNYPIEPLLDGVMGWVSFGHTVSGDANLALRFSRPDQAMFVPKSARFYDYLPIPDVSVYEGTSKVAGDVRIVAQPPFVAEIKDMRLDGETQDRKMLVISLLQTEEVMGSFAGPCGKRPETGNCVNTPITSIAGVAPDCSGNINIQFDPEIIVRNFTNPFYPMLDPLPYRGGICLDAGFTVDQMCSKVQTLPDDNGILPGTYSYERPCDLTVPFTTSFSDADSFKQVQLTSGYVYMHDHTAYITAGVQQAAELAPCLATLQLSHEYPTARQHKATFGDVPYRASVGMFVLDTGDTRILAKATRGKDEDTPGTWSVVKYNKGLQQEEQVFGSGSIPAGGSISSISIKVTSERKVSVAMGVGSASFQLDPDDVYFDPTGKAGVYIGGADTGYGYIARPAVSVTGYEAKDVAP